MYLDHAGTTEAEWARRSLLESGTDDEKAGRYADDLAGELSRHLTEGQIPPHRVGAPLVTGS